MRSKFGLAAFAVFSLLQGSAWADTENTQPPLQITHRTGVKVVIQVNDAGVMPMNGISKQVMAAKNLHDQYAALGMKPGQDYEIVMVFRAAGSQFLLTDDAYANKARGPHEKTNPSRAIIEALQNDGVKMYECGVAMKLMGYQPADIMPFARVVASGIGAIVDFEQSGYSEITP